MLTQRTSSEAGLVDVLDRVLDKGVVIDAWMRVSLVGIDLLTVEARVVVASIATYLEVSDALTEAPGLSKPSVSFPRQTVTRQSVTRKAVTRRAERLPDVA